MGENGLLIMYYLSWLNLQPGLSSIEIAIHVKPSFASGRKPEVFDIREYYEDVPH